MDNATNLGMKVIAQKITKMEKSLEDISKSLEQIAKIMNRQVPKPINFVTCFNPIEEAEDEDDLR